MYRKGGNTSSKLVFEQMCLSDDDRYETLIKKNAPKRILQVEYAETQTKRIILSPSFGSRVIFEFI